MSCEWVGDHVSGRDGRVSGWVYVLVYFPPPPPSLPFPSLPPPPSLPSPPSLPIPLLPPSLLLYSLDNELDLVDTQQLELDDVLTQLETNLSQYTPVLAEAQHADLERTRT